MALEHSESFRRLREQTQDNFDFAVLACTAVPQLKHALQQAAKDPDYLLVQNSHFKTSEEPYSSEKRMIPRYKTVLGANFFISSFSFFEAYVFSLVDEMINFHGGDSALLTFVKHRLSEPRKEHENLSAQKLQKKHKKEHASRYEKFSRELSENSFIWPTDRLALYGISQLIANRKKLKSADIPDLLANLFLFDMQPDSRNKFHGLRDIRNKIAHGKKLGLDLTKAVQGNQFMYQLAKDLDKHVVQLFFVIERYR